MSRWDWIRERRVWRLAGIVMLAILLITSIWWAPPLLSHMAFFNVRHVEVVGTTLLDPSDVVAAMQLDTTRSVWANHDSLGARVARHPQVATVRIGRRLPSTLVVQVTEVPPVAFVPTARGLTALDAEGDTLPIDPVRTQVSLPIIARRDTALLRLLGTLREEAPELFDRISEVRRVADQELLLVMPTLRVRATADLSSERLADILPVERDLARRNARVVELDLRYRDQVVARVQ